MEVILRNVLGMKRNFRAGFQRRVLELQDDIITDVVRWPFGPIISECRLICIVGSVWRIRALMGVVKTPDLYRCAVSPGGQDGPSAQTWTASWWLLNQQQGRRGARRCLAERSVNACLRPRPFPHAQERFACRFSHAWRHGSCGTGVVTHDGRCVEGGCMVTTYRYANCSGG